MTGRIDVHHHIMPPDYVAIMGAQRIGAPSTSRRIPSWSPDMATEVLERNGIAKAYTSISAPGVLLEDSTDTARLARLCNDYAARLAADHPGRFGTFAILPLPDVEASIREVDYATETLRADGVVLMSSYEGRYLGDPAFDSLMAHLNERRAIVFVHPTDCGCASAHPAASLSLLEFPFDTTRTIVSLLFSRVFERYRAIRFIFSHAGGALPFLAGRIAALSARNPLLTTGAPIDVGALRGLYYDTALSATRPVFAALREVTDMNHVLFGTDYPFAPKASVQATIEGLRGLGLSADEQRGIECANAQRLFGGS